MHFEKHHHLGWLAAWAVLGWLAALAPVEGAILFSGNASTGTPAPTLTITADIVLTATGTGAGQLLVFDEWTTSDGSNTGLGANPDGQSVGYTINASGALASQIEFYRTI